MRSHSVFLGLGGFTLSRLDGSASEAVGGGPDASEISRVALLPLEAPAVAVLPFTLVGGNEADGFADGMHEELIHALAQVSGLIVKSRQSVLQYRGSEKSMGQIAQDLGADAMVEGSVRMAGDRLRVTVQLIEARSDAHLWSKTFDGTLSVGELFSIQEEVAREVALALEVRLTSGDNLRLGHRPTDDLDAHTVFLQAQTAQRVDDAEARRLLHLAIAMDSSYDRPWGLLAEFVGGEAFVANDPLLADSALALAEKALMLDPTRSSGDPYNGIGFALMTQGRAAEARMAFATGMKNVPNDPALANNFGAIHAQAGAFPEAVSAFRRGVEITPGHIGNRTNLAQLYAALGLRGRAEHLLNEARALQPTYGMVVGSAAILQALWGDPESGLASFVEWEGGTDAELREEELRTGATLALWAGDFAQARSYTARALETPSNSLPLLGGHMAQLMLGFLLSREGHSVLAESHLTEAQGLLEPAIRGGSEFPQLYLEVAAIATIRGELGTAISWLERAYELGYRYPDEIDLDPIFEPLQDHPRFEEITAQMRADVAEMRETVLRRETGRG